MSFGYRSPLFDLAELHCETNLKKNSLSSGIWKLDFKFGELHS